MLLCRSSAKVNLTLDVLGRRDDGYHELRSIVHTVGLWDILSFDFGLGPGLSLRCNDARLRGEDNLCLKAARAWLEAARAIRPLRFNGLRITLQKSIPLGAGLGGGSGNAAATLLALNRHFDNLLDDAALHRTAATLGADVPLFLRGGCALMEGIGDRLAPLPPLQGWVLIVYPAAGLSTQQVYAAWDRLHCPSAQATERMRIAIAAGDLGQVAHTLSNDLSHAAHECGLAVVTLVEALQRCHALGASMTGSGSAVFGLFHSGEDARQAQEQIRLSQSGISNSVALAIAPFWPSGVEFVDSEANMP